MHHTQSTDTIHADKVCSVRPRAKCSSVASILEADSPSLYSFDCSSVTSDLSGDFRFQSCDFTSHYLSNQQYSITAVTTSSGSVAERYAYTAYRQPKFLDASGTPLTTQTSTLNARYLYTGREWYETLGMYHFRARGMSLLPGRFFEIESALCLDSAGDQVNLVPKHKNTECDSCGQSSFAITHSPDNNTVVLKGDFRNGYLDQEFPFAAAITTCKREECGPYRLKSLKICCYQAHEMLRVGYAEVGKEEVSSANARYYREFQGQQGLVDCMCKGVRAFTSNLRLLTPNDELGDWFNLRVSGGTDNARDSCRNPARMNPGSKQVVVNPPRPGWDTPFSQNHVYAMVDWNCCLWPKDGPATTCSPSGTKTNDLNTPILGD